MTIIIDCKSKRITYDTLEALKHIPVMVPHWKHWIIIKKSTMDFVGDKHLQPALKL